MRLQFCTSGLSSPSLRLQHNDSELVVEERDCLSITVHAASTTVVTHFSYKDKCGRSGSYGCHVEVVPPSGMHHGLSTDYLLVLMLAALFAVAIFFFIVSGVSRHCGQSEEIEFGERNRSLSPPISKSGED